MKVRTGFLKPVEKDEFKKFTIPLISLPDYIFAFHYMLASVNAKLLRKKPDSKFIASKPQSLYVLYANREYEKLRRLVGGYESLISMRKRDILNPKMLFKYIFDKLAEELKIQENITKNRILIMSASPEFSYIFTTFPITNVDVYIEELSDSPRHIQLIAGALANAKTLKIPFIFFIQYENSFINEKRAEIEKTGVKGINTSIFEHAFFPGKKIYTTLYMLTPISDRFIALNLYDVLTRLSIIETELENGGLADISLDKILPAETLRKIKAFYTSSTKSIAVVDYKVYLPDEMSLLVKESGLLYPFNIFFLYIFREIKTTKIFGVYNLMRLRFL